MQKHSQEVQAEALRVAKSIQKPKQTKEQTKLIAQGIEKGIAEYKKQQSKISRERDKAKKLKLKEKNNQEKKTLTNVDEVTTTKSRVILPWTLLAISWIGFLFFVYMR